MAKQSINIGSSANDGTGTPLRDAFDICNDNFTEIYAVNGGSAAFPTLGSAGQILQVNSGGNALEFAAASSGATDLNGLSDVSIDLSNDSAYFINIPAGLSGDSKNLVIGEGAANGFVNSNTSVVIGFDALKTNTNQLTGNVVVGTEAMENVTSGQAKNLVAIGDRAGKGVGNPFNAVIIGSEAAANNDNGYESVYIGKEAGKSANSNYQVFIGTKAGENANGATRAVAVGWNAGLSATGDDFVAIGYQAGRSNTSNTGIISVGYHSGYSNTSGSNNTNVGYRAGYSATTNSNRTYLGYEAGNLNTGAANTGVGYQACNGISSFGVAKGQGSNNTGVGYRALHAMNGIGASSNTAVGTNALSGVLTGANNTALGKDSGSTISSGSNLTVLGFDAEPSSNSATNEITLGNSSVTALRIPGLQSGASNGDVLTFNSGTGKITLAAASGGGGGASSLNGLSDCLVDTASLYVAEVPSGLSGNPQNNTILGIDAGTALTTGTDNTFIGHQAGDSYTTGIDSVMIGNRAGQATNGAQNVFIGNQAAENSTGSMHVAIGHRASSSGGSLGVVIGREAGLSNTGDQGVIIGSNAARQGNSAHNHISIGREAGYSNTSGGENTNIGYKAGYSNTTSSNRTAVGYGSLEFNTGSQNTAFGQYTLRGTSGASSGQFNTAVGYTAGEDITTGQTNSLFGWGAGKDITTGSNNTVLGYFAQPSSNTVSNEITLGNSSVTSLRIPGLDIASASTLRLHLKNHTTNTSTSTILKIERGNGSSPDKVIGFFTTTAERGSITVNDFGTAYNTSSDYRLKENVANITNGITRVKQLNPKRFNFIGSNQVVDGFLAHEAQSVVPEAVIGEKDAVDSDNNAIYQGIDQAKIVPLLTAALQEAITKIEQLETRIQTLENN